MSKKIISVMLALVLVLSAFATVAFAATSYEALDDEGKSEYTQTWALGEPVKGTDGKYTVTVSLTTNYPTGAIQFQVEETDANDVIALESVALGSAIGYDAEITKNSSGLVLIIPQTSADSNLIEAEAIDGVIATLTYSYTGTGSADIAIKNDPVTEETPYGTLIAARMGNSNIVSTNFIVGQTVESTGEKRTIGETTAPADLAVKSAYTSKGIVIDTAKTFGGAYAGVVYGLDLPADSNSQIGTTSLTAAYYTERFEATNGGTLSVTKTPYISRPASYGTGTTLKVTGTDGNSKTYLVVIFGDVNGDSKINTNDISETSTISMSNSTYSADIKRMAANVAVASRGMSAQKHYDVATDDIATLLAAAQSLDGNFVNGNKTVTQATLAASHSSYNTYYQ